jgi:hypothetical protein
MPPSDDPALHNLYMTTLSRIESKVDSVFDKVNQHAIDIAVLKTKAGLFGAVFGAVAGAISTYFIRRST